MTDLLDRAVAAHGGLDLIPTKRRVFARQPDNTPALDVLTVSIDLSDIRCA